MTSLTNVHLYAGAVVVEERSGRVFVFPCFTPAENLQQAKEKMALRCAGVYPEIDIVMSDVYLMEIPIINLFDFCRLWAQDVRELLRKIREGDEVE